MLLYSNMGEYNEQNVESKKKQTQMNICKVQKQTKLISGFRNLDVSSHWGRGVSD